MDLAEEDLTAVEEEVLRLEGATEGVTEDEVEEASHPTKVLVCCEMSGGHASMKCGSWLWQLRANRQQQNGLIL